MCLLYIFVYDMSEIVKTYQQQVEPENPKANRAFRIVLAVCAALIAGASLSFALREVKHPEKAERTGSSGAAEVTVPVNEVNILGNYMVRLESDSDTLNLTGYIESDALGQIALYVLSAYAPKVYPLAIDPEGTVYNQELGEGRMTFRKASDKTSITFNNGISTCILVK